MGGPTVIAADGLTVDTYTGSGAPARALVTLSTTLGTFVGADASSLYQGFQEQADSGGNFSFQVQRPTGIGTGSGTLVPTRSPAWPPADRT